MTKRKIKTNDLAYIGLFVVLIAICAWISIPFVVPFTLQTFAIFMAVRLLGGKRGFFALAAYFLLGAAGLPVFAGFKSGLGALLGTTGGYILGFVFIAAAYWLVTAFFGEKIYARVAGMLLGLLLCYAFGTAWFIVFYAQTTGPIGISVALGMCVLPFVPLDIIKMALALLAGRKLEPYISL